MEKTATPYHTIVSADLVGFLNKALKDIMSALDAECGSLFLFDNEHSELVLDAFYNTENKQIKGLRIRIGDGVSGKVAGTKSPVVVKDIDTDSRFSRNGYKHYHTKSFISVPLLRVIDGSVMGLINVADKTNGESFSDKDLEFAVKLCKYACIISEYLLRHSKLSQEKETVDKQNLLLNKYASVGKLAAEVVHEVNSPLDGIIRYTNILLGQNENHSVSREYLLEVKKGLGRIANITHSLLEFSYHVNSYSTKAKCYSDIHELLHESLTGLSEKSACAKIEIITSYDKSIPKMLNLGLSSVFTNLIKNAIDAMPSGGKIEIKTESRDDFVKVSFKDTGAGMPNEIVRNIFEPFFTTKTIGSGLGLGLAICKEIIDKYEGRIEVESSEGKGSTFTVIIPKKHLENG